MRFELPITFEAKVLPEGRRRAVTKTYSENLVVDIPEVSSSEAPASVSWVTRKTNRKPDGTRLEALWLGDRNYMLPFGSKSDNRLPIERQISKLLIQKFGPQDISEATPFHRDRPLVDIVDGREMEHKLSSLRDLADGLLLVDGKLHAAVGTPTYRINRMDVDLGNRTYTFKPFPGLTGTLNVLFYSADEFELMREENFGNRARGANFADMMEVDILIPEALEFNGPAVDVLNASVVVLQESFHSVKGAVLNEDENAPEVKGWHLWGNLRDALNEARHNQGDDEVSALCNALEDFVEYTCFDFTDPKYTPRKVRQNIVRWQERPVETELRMPNFG